jgi:hypothetical protein
MEVCLVVDPFQNTILQWKHYSILSPLFHRYIIPVPVGTVITGTNCTEYKYRFADEDSSEEGSMTISPVKKICTMGSSVLEISNVTNPSFR